MDKSWMQIRNRLLPEYKRGVVQFLNFAWRNKNSYDKLKCPCVVCENRLKAHREIMYEHLIMNGILDSYTFWEWHGEKSGFIYDEDDFLEEEEDDLVGLCEDGFGILEEYDNDFEINEDDPAINGETKSFFKLLQNAKKMMYEGSKVSLLSFLIRLLRVKSTFRWSNNSFSVLLEILKATLPSNEAFPSSYREAWKIIKDLGLKYKKIHACPNDCMLYWKETENETVCMTCKTPRYKSYSCSDDGTEPEISKVPAKVLRYFPLIPRLQRRFMCSKTSELMRWHAEGRIDDGVLRHPADALAWKSIDQKNELFSREKRNVRLGLATDGFNPFKSMRTSHSTWPVIIIPYNVPPGMCMSKSNFILSSLIDGPSAPGNDIDVFLRPLIDELKELWEHGVTTYDATSKEMFRMRAVLMWTISDFPGYGNVSGWNVKTEFGCPCCGLSTNSKWLKHSKKYCFRGHRRFLDANHKFRDDYHSFDGDVEYGEKPTRLVGDDLLEEVNNVVTTYGKKLTPKKRKRNDDGHNRKKRSALFDLPYWKDNVLPHNLDLMHVQNNVTHNVAWTILDIKGKTKDDLAARKDLQVMGIRKSLHPQSRGNNKEYLPAASFRMGKREKELFCEILKNVKMPDGFASNISRCIKKNGCNLSGLKSHDNHVLMEVLLPITLRHCLPKNVAKVLIELSNCFRQLSSKTSRASDFEALQDRIAITLCHMERIFPPSFFDIMVHLPIHLAEEAKIGGPVQFRSMWAIERYLFILKSYVLSKRYPEASMAATYLVTEFINFASMYTGDQISSETDGSRRNYEGYENICKGEGRVIGATEIFKMEKIHQVQAHRYILGNSSLLAPYRMEHIRTIQRKMRRADAYEQTRVHNETFHKWLREHVNTLDQHGRSDQVTDEVRCLARGPERWGKRYSGYIINGFRFHTKDREKRRTTQNSGVLLSATAECFSSRKDKRPISDVVNYYGILTDIVELRYTDDMKYVVFKCDWADTNVGIKEDELHFTLVNFKHLLYKHNRASDEPFILASQAQQVFYVQDPVEKEWHVAVKTTPRDVVNMSSEGLMEDVMDNGELDLLSVQSLNDTLNNSDGDDTWIRTDVEGTIVDGSIIDSTYQTDIEEETESESGEEDLRYSDDD